VLIYELNHRRKFRELGGVSHWRRIAKREREWFNEVMLGRASMHLRQARKLLQWQIWENASTSWESLRTLITQVGRMADNPGYPQQRGSNRREAEEALSTHYWQRSYMVCICVTALHAESEGSVILVDSNRYDRISLLQPSRMVGRSKQLIMRGIRSSTR
jgi:hypothetical protein